ncbi:hypothetical protein J2T15_001863 [Paenibacillus harenae]|uniref:Uncharacterized protein n=1 Tax=Paenibacillus harenae TaxID=306543 RepID=A0ABT9TYP5_PAEHA|nr:hypothetical protein [Paenibacillus harenae]
MKVFRKKAKPIVVNHNVFICVVVERRDDVIFRAYSGKSKSSFIEISFGWKECYYINLYRPRLESILIQHCLNLGWQHDKPKQIMRIKDSEQLIQKLLLL